MAIKNTLRGGTDWVDGDILYAADLNDTNDSYYQKVYFDNTTNTVDNSTTETDLTTIVIPQTTAITDATIVINASMSAKINTGTSATHTARLYAGGGVVKTQNIDYQIINIKIHILILKPVLLTKIKVFAYVFFFH